MIRASGNRYSTKRHHWRSSSSSSSTYSYWEGTLITGYEFRRTNVLQFSNQIFDCQIFSISIMSLYYLPYLINSYKITHRLVLWQNPKCEHLSSEADFTEENLHTKNISEIGAISNTWKRKRRCKNDVGWWCVEVISRDADESMISRLANSSGCTIMR